MLVAFLVLVAAASAVAAYELRARDAPARIKPIELEPAREPVERPKASTLQGGGSPATRSGGGATPATPEPAPAGEPAAPPSAAAPSGGDGDGADEDDDGADEDDGGGDDGDAD